MQITNELCFPVEMLSGTTCFLSSALCFHLPSVRLLYRLVGARLGGVELGEGLL